MPAAQRFIVDNKLEWWDVFDLLEEAAEGSSVYDDKVNDRLARECVWACPPIKARVRRHAPGRDWE